MIQSRKRGGKDSVLSIDIDTEDQESQKKNSLSSIWVIISLFAIVCCLGLFGVVQKSSGGAVPPLERILNAAHRIVESDSVHNFKVINHPAEKLRGQRDMQQPIEIAELPPTQQVPAKIEPIQESAEVPEVVEKPVIVADPVSDEKKSEELEHQMITMIDELSNMKFIKRTVMETDPEAQTKIKETQAVIRQYMSSKYGPGPYHVEMKLKFPDSMPPPTPDGQGNNEATIIIEMGPIEHIPYSVYFFIENIVTPFRAGAFHRNAGHVLQAMVNPNPELIGLSGRKNFAWQEYSPSYPHKQYTLGYAGRPSGSSAFYISTLDNTHNHGPASQGSKTEADSCFGRVLEGLDVVKRMCTQPGADKGSGFIKGRENFIEIVSLTLLPS